jgi:hypothetical protein
MRRVTDTLLMLGILLTLCGCQPTVPRTESVCTPAQKALLPSWALECIRNANQSADDPEDTVPVCQATAEKVLCDEVRGFVYMDLLSGASVIPFQPCSTAVTEEERNVCPRGDLPRSP